MSEMTIKAATRQGVIQFPLTRGFEAIVDAADYDEVSKHKWSADIISKTVYAVRTHNRKRIYLHRQLLGFPPSRVDHINKNGLDCRRINLRLATGSQNSANSIKKNDTSKFKGVGWDKTRGLWKAQIKVNYKTRFLGRFKDESDAARAYDAAALSAWGEFATPNFK